MSRVALALLLLASACIHRPTPNPNVLVVGVTSGPNNLDPRIGTDDVSAKAAQLVFNNLMTLDDHLRVVPDLAERLDHPDRELYAEVQRIVAEEAPYISLWCKTNAAVARRDLSGIHILPIADFTFLKDVARESPRDARRAGF